MRRSFFCERMFQIKRGYAIINITVPDCEPHRQKGESIDFLSASEER